MYTSEDEDNMSGNWSEGSEDREVGDKEVDIVKQVERETGQEKAAWKEVVMEH